MKKMKRFAALALALGLTLTLGACKKSGLSTFDAKAYVEGLLKETYLGEFDEGYMTLVGITEEEAQATYENSLDVESNNFYYFYDIEYPTEEFHEKMMDLYKRIYAHAKFEVVSAAAQDDGSFSVKLSIEPIWPRPSLRRPCSPSTTSIPWRSSRQWTWAMRSMWLWTRSMPR